MVEIAADLMSIQIGAQNANVLKEEEGEVEELQHLPKLQLAKSAFLGGFLMATVRMKITMKPASLMEEIAVDLMSIQIIVLNAYALKEVEVAVELQHLLELQIVEAAIRAGLEMGIAMISTII
jgi:hypothetical protein